MAPITSDCDAMRVHERQLALITSECACLQLTFDQRIQGALATNGRSANTASDDVVERILDARGAGAGREYRVKWLGYPDAEATWEPIAHCSGCGKLIAVFERQAARAWPAVAAVAAATVEAMVVAPPAKASLAPKQGCFSDRGFSESCAGCRGARRKHTCPRRVDHRPTAAAADRELQPTRERSAAGGPADARAANIGSYVNLVAMCAYEAGRKEGNILRMYISPPGIVRQRAQLGEANVLRLLRYADQVYCRGAAFRCGVRTTWTILKQDGPNHLGL